VWPATCACLALVAAGCGSPPKPPPPTELTGSVQAAADINPSVSSRPSPLLVRVYELKATSAFNKSDFISLYQRDQAELGTEMVNREEMMLNPGDTRPINKIAAPETRFIGVFAAYRDLDHAQWRSVVAVQPNQKQHISIRADALAVSAVVGK
jgi:type VI secretion system protein VasD